MTTSSEITGIKKWIWGNGHEGADKIITRHDERINNLEDDVKCKADVVMVDGLAIQMSDMGKDIKKLLERSGGNLSVWQFISTLIAIAAVLVAIFK